MKQATKKKIIDFIKGLLDYEEICKIETGTCPEIKERKFNVLELLFEAEFPEYVTSKEGIIEKEIAKNFASQLIKNKAIDYKIEIVQGWTYKDQDSIKVTASMKYLSNQKQEES